MATKEFTLRDSLGIQRRQLQGWKLILKPETYKKLEEWAHKSNIGVTDPYKITRGSQLSEFVSNYILKLEHILCHFNESQISYLTIKKRVMKKEGADSKIFLKSVRDTTNNIPDTIQDKIIEDFYNEDIS